MNIGGFIKRFVPFVAAFAVGILVASFFVDLSKPRFGTQRSLRVKRYHEMQRLRIENEELRNDKLRLQNRLESLEAWRNEHLGVPHGHGFGSATAPLRHPELGELPMVHADEMPAPPPAPKRIK